MKGAMNTLFRFLPQAVLAIVVAMLAASPLAGQTAPGANRLILSGDMTYFMGMGKPRNCILNSRYKRGEPVGFRMTAINPETGKRDRATKLVVHLNYGGKIIDLPMRDHQNEERPETEFWTAKWIVPADAPTGIVRYTVTAVDPQGRTGEWKPFENVQSLLTIVE
jgi:hypothetical protein